MELKPPPKVFLDVNVLVAGSFSHKGASYKILDLCRQRKLQPQVCRQVLTEAERTIKNKIPQALPNYQKIIQSLTTLEILPDPLPAEIRKAQQIINPKDAPILAVAIKAKPDYFITLDIKHFDISPVKDKTQLNILTPGKFVKTKRW